MVGMLQRTWDSMSSAEAGASFLPLSFRFFASFGLLALHMALPSDVRAGGPGELVYLGMLLVFFGEAAWEVAQGLRSRGQLFPTPGLGWIRWNLLLDLALVTLVVAFQGVTQERFSTLYIFPVLASAFYLGTLEIVGVGTLSAITHVLVVLGFAHGLLPTFGLSSEFLPQDAGRAPFILGLASLQVFATTLVALLLRRNLDRLRTDLSVSEAVVGELSALHERVVESMSSGLITLDPEGRVTSANPAAVAILGRPITSGVAIEELLPLGSPLPLYRGSEHRFQLALPRSEGGRQILGGHLTALRGPNSEETGQLLLFQDLTELKALEERTRISERLAAIGQLAAGLAHELRNPLASISGCVQLLQREDSPQEVEKRVLGILDRETQRVGAILSDFLDFARPEVPGGSVLFLPKVLEEARASWEMDPRTKGLPLLMDEVAQVSCRSDATGLHRLLLNLLVNARKAVEGRPSPMVRLTCTVHEEGIRLSVADNGCGMTPEQLNQLYVPFSGSFREGTGLGMSLVYRFIQAMGWRIEVESEPGQGTRVQILIPPTTQEEPLASGPL